jgi:hypothetical protein
MTGFGNSALSYHNTMDGITGHSVLQGSSSAAPIYILNSDVSLSTYKALGCGASFVHPISGTTIHDKVVQYVDDTSQFLNSLGANIPYDPSDMKSMSTSLTELATYNSSIWSDYMWISGGCLNSYKCFCYAFFHHLNFKKKCNPMFSHPKFFSSDHQRSQLEEAHTDTNDSSTSR